MNLAATPTQDFDTEIVTDIEREDIYALIDEFTALTSKRSLISSAEVQDFCLDLRLILQLSE